jgi:HK97 family phage portal protein
MASRFPVVGAMQRFWARLTTPQRVDQMVFSIGPSIPGIRMHEWRDALKVPSVWRCVNIISDACAMLPWGVWQRGDDGTVTRVFNNPAEWLLGTAPNAEMTAFNFRKTLMVHALLQGNGYAEIERDKRGAPYALWLIDDPDRVEPGRDVNGRLVYKVTQPAGETVYIPAADMFHVRGLATEGIVGLGIMAVARRTLSINAALEDVTSSYFQQGMRTPGFVKIKGTKGLEALKNLVTIIREQFTGARNFHTPIPLDSDMEFQPAGQTLKDSEFIDMRKFSLRDVCRWFGVPPHLAYDLEDATFSNIEAQDSTFLKYGLLPRLVPLEQEADIKLLSERRAGRYSRINAKAFERGDTAARMALYQSMRNMGVYSANDILRKEDEPTIGKEGDVRTMQQQYTPVTEKKPATETPAEETDPPEEPKKIAAPAPAAVRRVS